MKEHRQITEILDQVEEHLPVGSKIIVACSGGADSIALADALLLLQEKRKYQLVVCHVEHGLRGSEALADADFVVEFCRMRQVACEVLRVDAKKFAAESKLSVEDAARKLRYTVLFEILSKHKSEYIVTAHHRDDQAETLLLHLLRGSGAEGLGGMRCHNNSIVRPFLQVSRRMLEAYCAMRSLDYRTDSSNMDLYYTRNKVRHILLPLLEREFNPNIKQALAQTATLTAEDADCLNELAEEKFLQYVLQDDHSCSCDTAWLLSLPAALCSMEKLRRINMKCRFLPYFQKEVSFFMQCFWLPCLYRQFRDLLAPVFSLRTFYRNVKWGSYWELSQFRQLM